MSFEKIKNKLGFGCMRLKMNGDKVDYTEFCKMIDDFLDSGFNYFDTAHGYIDGKSETAIGDCLSARHRRESFVLANKLSDWYFETEADILPLFESQLKACKVDYFDFYLFHCLTRKSYPKHKACNSFEIIKKLKAEGKIKHIAMSFHDTADVLDMILTEQPCIEAVQLQINYLDEDDPGVQSKACYEVAVKHGKKVIVMEPVRGGALANLSDKAKAVFDALGTGASYASYALRYAASYPDVFMVLSGMGNTEMMRDNINTFTNFEPLSPVELYATCLAREIIRKERLIKCTGCGYCTEVCANNIPIPDIFKIYNSYLSADVAKSNVREQLKATTPNAADCAHCKACEKVCPQAIEINDLLEKITKL